MKRFLLTAIATVMLAALLWGPKELWFRSLDQRMRDLDTRSRFCRDSACRKALGDQYDLLTKDAEKPPWYVWRGQDFK